MTLKINKWAEVGELLISSEYNKIYLYCYYYLLSPYCVYIFLGI